MARVNVFVRKELSTFNTTSERIGIRCIDSPTILAILRPIFYQYYSEKFDRRRDFILIASIFLI